MPASSNFNQAIREAQTSSIVGPNVVQKALPYVGGGMALTSFGALGGLTLSQSPIYGPLFIVAIIAQLVLFFVASSAANNANNNKSRAFPASINSCINCRIDIVFYSHKCCK